MQKIIIKYLGPVRELEMEIKDFNLLIGEQATGKSTVAKAIYFFRIIKSTLTDYLCQLYDTALYNGNDVSDGFNKVLKKELKSVFISLFGYSWDLDKRLYLRYEYTTGIWIDVKLNDKGKKQYISVRYSPKLAQTLKTLEEEALDLFEQKMETATISLAYASRERLRNYDNFKNRVNEIFDDYKETYYIPAGRSMLTLLVNNRSLLENDNLDLITRQFMQVIDNIHRVFEDGIKNVHKRYPDGERKFDVTKTAEMLISDLKGDYRYNAGKEYIVIEEDAHSEKIPINFASSGQQEVLWLLNQLYILMLKKEKAFVIIEEPEMGAVNENDCVDIDTGAVIFSTDMLSSLYSLISTTEDYHKYVNDTVRLSLYGDFLYPLAEDSTLEKFYDEKPEGEFCAELHAARAEVWKVLRPYRMKLLRLAPAKFIHFGTTREILALMSGGVDAYKALGWSKKVNSSISGNTAGYNSVLSERAEIGDDCYLEVSFVHSKASVGKNVVLSYIDIHDEQIPDDVVLHGLKQKDGKFVCRIYGVEDNPKENRLFGMNLEEALEQAGIQPSEVWDQEEHLLWFAKIYPECGNIRDAVDAALNLYDLLHGKGDLEAWKKMQKKSLCSGFNDADSSAIIAWNKRMQELVRMDEIAKDIRYGKPVKETAALEPLTQLQENWLERRLKRADFSETVRLNYYIGTALGSRHGDRYVAESFKTISGQILEATLQNLQYNDSCKIVTEKHTVNLPLRVNWGGGWSDTPPICCEMGGTVLNAAISLNGELPVEVTLIKIPEKKIVFDSRDMDVHGEFDSIEELQKTGDPYDPFALQKACLLACGIIPSEGGSLDEILTRLGGGFEMHSEVMNVPKGSGLGTSSILSAACVKAVFEFMGISYTEEELYAHVLVMEQIMSTGGGWQDQVGGVTNGIKYITSKPGLDQQLRVEHIELQPETKKELNERFCLIYTGQRRLARNLLRDVVGRYVGNEPDSLYALNEIQKVAALMRFELERGKIDEFADLLNYHWELSRKVDAGSTNTLIDQIFLSIEDLIDAKMVCGAGGGGFLQVILKKGVQKADVHKRLKDVFQDNPVDVWDCEII